MKRRRFLVTSLVTFLARPCTAVGEQPSVRKIGFIAMVPRTPVSDTAWDALVTGLREHGWIEHRNILIERRYAEQRAADAVAAAEALLRSGVEVIVVASTPAALAAKQATRTIPIVMTVPADPVAVGLVASLARPGGNVTGLSLVGTEVAAKQVELLKEVVPGLSSIAVLANPTNASHAPRAEEIVASARVLRLRADTVEANTRGGVGDAFTVMVKRGVGAAVVLPDALFLQEVNSVVRLAAERRLPVIYGLREAPLAGGLMSYGPNFADSFRRAAGYVDKILRGTHPRDLPIEQASRLELVVNLSAAKALGLSVPRSLLLRADQVIE
jgi:putative tryptophan/tyrosine transport system substrate-binding protein